MNEIEEHIREGEARVELACHYKNPYPRLVNQCHRRCYPFGMFLSIF